MWLGVARSFLNCLLFHQRSAERSASAGTGQVSTWEHAEQDWQLPWSWPEAGCPLRLWRHYRSQRPFAVSRGGQADLTHRLHSRPARSPARRGRDVSGKVQAIPRRDPTASIQPPLTGGSSNEARSHNFSDLWRRQLAQCGARDVPGQSNDCQQLLSALVGPLTTAAISDIPPIIYVLTYGHRHRIVAMDLPWYGPGSDPSCNDAQKEVGESMSDTPGYGNLSRRKILKAATGAAAGLYAGGIPGKSYLRARAQDSILTQILSIPGAGAQPSEADMERVGELCLHSTKKGAFAGQTVTFIGLNNAGMNNDIFRPFSRSWEEYTGATINWIDVPQPDIFAKVQLGIATGEIEFDVLQGGAPWEGDLLGKGLCSPMPDWVKEQIAIDDYVKMLQAPVGTWDGVTYRVSLDGDCHNFNYRTDVYASPDLAAEWVASGGEGDWSVPTTWRQVQDTPRSWMANRSTATTSGDISTLSSHGEAFPGTSSPVERQPMRRTPNILPGYSTRRT